MNKLNNKGFAISTIIYGTLILFVVLMTVLMFTLQFRYRNLSNSNLVSNSGSIENTDTTGKPNPPDLSTGLIPIKYEETKSKWVVTSESDSDWYDYDNQKWANAASLKSTEKKIPGTELDIENDAYAMFVWIPRYSYTIGCTTVDSVKNTCLGYKIDRASNLSLYTSTPGAIDIKFVSKDTPKEEYQNSGTVLNAPTYTYDSLASRTPSNWYTHPAFTFGDKELSGIWVGKFETTGTVSEPTILPNKTSLTNQPVSEQFTTALKFTTNTSTYGLSGEAHMMKNSEWGAVAYLSQSIYGKYGNPNYEGANKEIYINNSSDMYTGRSGASANRSSEPDGIVKYDDILVADSKIKIDYTGTGASTTGNIYGIYDMSGGAYEYVMGYYNNTPANSGFGTPSNPWPDEKYFDKYIKLFDVNDQAQIGGTVLETTSWYDDENMVEEVGNWLLRGGIFSIEKRAGIFTWITYDGSGFPFYSFRVSLISTN